MVESRWSASLRQPGLRLPLLTLVPAMCELVAEHGPDTESIHDKILQFGTLTNICRAIAQSICNAVVIDVIKRLADTGQDHKVVAAEHRECRAEMNLCRKINLGNRSKINVLVVVFGPVNTLDY